MVPLALEAKTGAASIASAGLRSQKKQGSHQGRISANQGRLSAAKTFMAFNPTGRREELQVLSRILDAGRPTILKGNRLL
jgi:hypothetical protein